MATDKHNSLVNTRPPTVTPKAGEAGRYSLVDAEVVTEEVPFDPRLHVEQVTLRVKGNK